MTSDGKSEMIQSKIEHETHKFIIRNLLPGVEYYIRVIGYNSNGYGDAGFAKALNSFMRV